jgi:hypothetical protein
MPATEKALRIDIPVKLSEAKVVFSIGDLQFEGDLPASLFHMQLIKNDIADWGATSEIVAVFHTNAGTAINRGTDAPCHQGILRYRQRAETRATTKPTRSAGRPECFWPGDSMRSGGIAAACTPRASFPGRSFRSPNSSDQDAAS